MRSIRVLSGFLSSFQLILSLVWLSVSAAHASATSVEFPVWSREKGTGKRGRDREKGTDLFSSVVVHRSDATTR